MITKGDVAGWVYHYKDVLTGAEITQGVVHPYEPARADLLTEATAYVFKPPLTIRPGTMLIFRHEYGHEEHEDD